MPGPAYDGLRFECTQCGACCKRRDGYAYVYLNDSEVEALAEYLNLDDRVFRERHTFVDALGWTQIRFEGELCPFLDPATNRCGVYPARPTQCSTFPFWREFVAEGQWTSEVASLCEGIGRGEVQDENVVGANMRAMQAWDEAESEPER